MRTLLIIALLFPSLAHAQPELKVGQEVKWDCNTCTYEGNGLYSCTAMLCFKPAPRPEFELPLSHPVVCRSGKAKRGCPNYLKNDEVIAKELRFLRKWQDELKKERAELRKEIEALKR